MPVDTKQVKPQTPLQTLILEVIEVAQKSKPGNRSPKDRNYAMTISALERVMHSIFFNQL